VVYKLIVVVGSAGKNYGELSLLFNLRYYLPRIGNKFPTKRRKRRICLTYCFARNNAWNVIIFSHKIADLPVPVSWRKPMKDGRIKGGVPASLWIVAVLNYQWITLYYGAHIIG